MRVLVAGATGAVGVHLVSELVDRGHDVIATTRSPDKQERLRALGAEPALLDGLDAAAVLDTVVRVAPEGIVHEMTSLRGRPDFRHFDRYFATTNLLRTKGTANLIAAAQTAGVKRLVVQSYTGWNNIHRGGPVKSEADPLEPQPAPQQRETHAAIVEMESMVLDAPMDGIVVRYANLYGPQASASAIGLLKKRMFPIIGDGNGVSSWLHVEDAAIATADALERARPGVYNIADDDPATTVEWLPYLAEVTGAPKPFRVPVWLGRLLAGEAAVLWLTEGRGSSNAKAKTEFGWHPTRASWRQGFRELSSTVAPVRVRGRRPSRRPSGRGAQSEG
jgi:nucleoside-diphosphate-sugar epimerase